MVVSMILLISYIPRMYGVVKPHKPEKNFPMRIVVSTIGTPSYRTSEYLVKIIQPTLNKNKTRLKNSYTFVETSKTWSIENEEVQVSYDVVNLYPSVPVKEATDIIIEILSTDPELTKRTKLSLPDIRSLIDLCLSKCYFLWEEKIYLLKNSAPIGLALMVVIAEAFLQYHEKNAIDTAQQRNPSVAPKSFLRYVDDSHVRFQDLQTATQFHTILNEQDPHIQYTMETKKLWKIASILRPQHHQHQWPLRIQNPSKERHHERPSRTKFRSWSKSIERNFHMLSPSSPHHLWRSKPERWNWLSRYVFCWKWLRWKRIEKDHSRLSKQTKR